MSDVPSEREQKREALLQRIAVDRGAISRTLTQLRQPIVALDRWQRRARDLLSVLPTLLLGLAATWLLLRLLGRQRGDGSALSTVHPASHRRHRRPWLSVMQQLMSTWRIALQLMALVRASVGAAPAVLPLADPSSRPQPSPETHVTQPTR